MTWLVVVAVTLNLFAACLTAYNWRRSKTFPARLEADRERFLRDQRIAAYRAELEAHRAKFDAWTANNAEIRRLRDAEPITRCERCTAEMRQGDYRCHVCGTPNPGFVDRGLQPILWGA